MTPSGWLLLAVAITLVTPRRDFAGRVAALAAAGRLSVVPARHHLPLRRVSRTRVAGLLLGGAVLVVLLAGGVVLAVAATVAAAAGWLLARDAVARKQDADRRRDVRIGLRVLIGELEAGAHPPAALAAARDAAPLQAETFGSAAAAATDSADAAAVLLAQPATRPIGLAWQLGADTGIALAAVLDRVAADLQAEHDQRRSVEAVLAGPRASALLLTGLPLVGIALGSAMGARPIAVLTSTRAGQLLCLAGVVLDVAGLMWMRRLLARAERA